MMFNGLLMCGDSDTSDFTKESIGASCSSAADTCGSSWAADARADHYHNKLLATLQVLQNKEETVRVQAESLRVAEARIAQLTARAQRLREQLDDKPHEELKTQKALVRALQTNLSVIEDLYRESFYESAKQEELIEGLRQSYLDARAKDRQRSEDVGRLRPVDSDQYWSVQHYQGIATEVDNLKSEISNFLNSSNNDSGMWERGEDSLSSEVLDDLHHIGDQLLQLRTMLTGNCTCGLEEENTRLKNANEAMTAQVGDLRQRVSELELAVAAREDTERYKTKLEETNQELESVRQRLVLLEEDIRQKNDACETYTQQIQRSQEVIEDQGRQLSEARQHYSAQETTIKSLQQELNRCNDVIEERSLAADTAREHARQLAAELAHVTKETQELEDNLMRQGECARSLGRSLCAAEKRGRALCADMRGLAAAARQTLRLLRQRHRDQEETIKEQEAIINALRYRLEKSKSETRVRLEEDTCCTKCVSLRSKRFHGSANKTTSCCANLGESRDERTRTSASEIPSGSSAPTPPRRLLRKKSPCNTAGWFACGTREARVHSPRRRDDATAAPRTDTLQREMSPSSELEARMCALQAALDQSTRRWARAS